MKRGAKLPKKKYSALTKRSKQDKMKQKPKRCKMAAPFSKDLRERIIKKHQKGKKPIEIQRELEIKSLSSVCSIIKHYNETGSIEPRPLNNGRPAKMTPHTILQS
jgi:hypothetical protein